MQAQLAESFVKGSGGGGEKATPQVSALERNITARARSGQKPSRRYDSATGTMVERESGRKAPVKRTIHL
jgi:hypothetical protein